VLHKVVMTLKNLLGLKDLAGLPLLYAGLPFIGSAAQSSDDTQKPARSQRPSRFTTTLCRTTPLLYTILVVLGF
jgi:hypothetical protein